MGLLLRFLALALLAFVVLRLLRTLFALLAGPPAAARGAADPRRPGGVPERLVEDPVCGLRLPESRAIRDGDRFFCSEECRGRFQPSA